MKNVAIAQFYGTIAIMRNYTVPTLLCAIIRYLRNHTQLYGTYAIIRNYTVPTQLYAIIRYLRNSQVVGKVIGFNADSSFLCLSIIHGEN